MIGHYCIIWSEHQRELVAGITIRKLGAIDVCVPRRFVTGEKPMLRFPRYVFAATDFSDEEINQISRARGVEELVKGAGGKPYRIAKSVVDEMKNREDEEFDAIRFRRKAVTETNLSADDFVEVSEKGIWWGRKGQVMSIAHGKALVLIGAMAKEFLVTDLKREAAKT